MLLFRIRQGVEALRFLGALPVDDQMARDGEKPGFEFRFAVVLMAAFENADPGFLKEILGTLLVSNDVNQVTEQAVLILLDQTIKQIRIAPLQTARDVLSFIDHQRKEKQGWTGHGRSPKKADPMRNQT